MTQRSSFWLWRHARPFWGGLFVLIGGIEILLTVWAPLPVVLHVGMQGLAGYLVPVVLVMCGVLLFINPQQRLFYSLIAAVLALVSWITSNLGGFVFGMIFVLIGAALAFAWSPTKKVVEWQPDWPSAEAQQPAADDESGWWHDDETVVQDAQAADATPGVQPETSHRRPRHSRSSPGSPSGE